MLRPHHDACPSSSDLPTPSQHCHVLSKRGWLTKTRCVVGINEPGESRFLDVGLMLQPGVILGDLLLVVGHRQA